MKSMEKSPQPASPDLRIAIHAIESATDAFANQLYPHAERANMHLLAGMAVATQQYEIAQHIPAEYSGTRASTAQAEAHMAAAQSEQENLAPVYNLKEAEERLKNSSARAAAQSSVLQAESAAAQQAPQVGGGTVIDLDAYREKKEGSVPAAAVLTVDSARADVATCYAKLEGGDSYVQEAA